ncbi:MAG TPA: molybdopterin-guanine dinucleotide biosynthesis protein B [Methylococcus sp.]|nr:molybdopterin-guanine dinucleotide biosynthesis protein B [Methylococcus sp.]
MPNPVREVPILGFAAYSGTGKTTLLKSLIPLLRGRGLRVGVVKHAHHAFEIDQPGKDSFELRSAGASPIMLSSSRRRAIITEHETPREPRLAEELQHFDHTDLDLILVEGFKNEPIPKIELYRPALGKPLLYPRDECIIALATDQKERFDSAPIPLLDLNNPTEVADFISAWLSRQGAREMPLGPVQASQESQGG